MKANCKKVNYKICDKVRIICTSEELTYFGCNEKIIPGYEGYVSGVAEECVQLDNLVCGWVANEAIEKIEEEVKEAQPSESIHRTEAVNEAYKIIMRPISPEDIDQVIWEILAEVYDKGRGFDGNL